MAVVTLPDIGLRAPVDVALAIGRAWGVGANAAIGQRTRNAGVVILLVPKETSASGRGECFVTTGQGTEGFITDAEAASICREAVPYFQQREYGPAMELVASRVASSSQRSSASRSTRRPDWRQDAARHPAGASTSRRGAGFRRSRSSSSSSWRT
jgi:uncharacterized protein